jgi:hypothetical protein
MYHRFSLEPARLVKELLCLAEMDVLSYVRCLFSVKTWMYDSILMKLWVCALCLALAANNPGPRTRQAGGLSVPWNQMGLQDSTYGVQASCNPGWNSYRTEMRSAHQSDLPKWLTISPGFALFEIRLNKRLTHQLWAAPLINIGLIWPKVVASFITTGLTWSKVVADRPYMPSYIIYVF